MSLLPVQHSLFVQILSLWTALWILYLHPQAQTEAAAHAELNGNDEGENESGSSSRQNGQISKIFCQLNKKEYSPGDIWYPDPVSIKSSVNICIRCTCLLTGRLNCTRESCPSNCEDSSDPCCKTCSAIPNTTISRDGSIDLSIGTTNRRTEGSHGSESEGQGGSSSSAEDMEEDLEEDNISCLHQGKVYREGEVFTPNVTGLPIAAPGQCMQCQCQSGMVLCAMKYCTSLKCSLADFTMSISGSGSSGDTCCQRCAAWRSRVTGPGSINQKPVNEIIQNRIVSNHVKDGSQQMTTSFNGGRNRQFHESQPQQPRRISSPPLDSSVTFRDISTVNNVLGSNRPTRKPVDDCISSGIFYLHGSTWHPVIGPFGPMECVSCKCNHGQIECGRLKCQAIRELTCTKPVKVEGHCCPICTAPNDKTFEEGTSLCVSSKQDITAFKSSGIGQNETEYIEFAFLRPRKLAGGSDAQVERHEWKLLGPDIEEFTTQYLSLVQFEALRNRQAFTLLGATNEKNVEKFTRREKKLEKRCTSRCNVRISSLERSLRLHKLISRVQCLGHERTVHTI